MSQSATLPTIIRGLSAHGGLSTAGPAVKVNADIGGAEATVVVTPAEAVTLALQLIGSAEYAGLLHRLRHALPAIGIDLDAEGFDALVAAMNTPPSTGDGEPEAVTGEVVS